MMVICLIYATILYKEPTSAAFEKLNNQARQIQKSEQTQQKQPLYAQNTIDYSLQNNQLNITFDKGKTWKKVPVEKEKLFEGEYNGNQQELIAHSYMLTKKCVSFLFSERPDSVNLIYSLDQGETWKKSSVTDHFLAVRFRKVSFLSDKFGYVILSGDRTMSQEISKVFLTVDGGKHWKETTNSGVTMLISDGNFINKKTGFLSYGIINPEEPMLYETNDSGNTWNEAKINMPAKYQKIFVMAETPFKEGNHLAVFINQGPSGDYLGGKIKGKFLSKDNGRTWEFSEEVTPNEAKQS